MTIETRRLVRTLLLGATLCGCASQHHRTETASDESATVASHDEGDERAEAAQELGEDTPRERAHAGHARTEEARAASRNLGQDLAEGVYAGLLGPSYETPAEIRMLRTLGADAVGMSTVLETIALREKGVRVGAVSCITNVAAGLASGVLSHAEVQETAAQARSRFAALLDAWVVRAAALG